MRLVNRDSPATCVLGTPTNMEKTDQSNLLRRAITPTNPLLHLLFPEDIKQIASLPVGIQQFVWMTAPDKIIPLLLRISTGALFNF